MTGTEKPARKSLRQAAKGQPGGTGRKRQSWYVERSRAYPAAHGYTGPVRSVKQARREQDAWREAGWSALLLPSTPAVRRAVREWQREADRKHGRKHSHG